MSPRRSVFITGANGYIGAAVSRAFVRAGWNVYGLIRRAEAAPQLLQDEITPIIGSLPSPGAGSDSPDLSFLSGPGPDALYRRTQTFDAIVGCTENVSDYPTHYAQVLALFRALATTSNARGVRPLVLWTSGSKDYGFSPLDGTPGLAPHTEASPLETLDFVKPRMTCSLKILEADNAALFDAAVLRPPNVYGYSSSYYGILFEWAEQVKAHQVQVQAASEGEGEGEGYELAVDPRTILSALHVDDCAEAYVALAEHPDRAAHVAGQCFNIGPYQYETAGKVLAGLAREYDIPGGFRFTGPDSEQARKNTPGTIGSLLGWSQWLGSDKIREVTGWGDKRMLFGDNLAVYRRAYEEAVRTGHEDVGRVAKMKPLFDASFPA